MSTTLKTVMHTCYPCPEEKTGCKQCDNCENWYETSLQLVERLLKLDKCEECISSKCNHKNRS